MIEEQRHTMVGSEQAHPPIQILLCGGGSRSVEHSSVSCLFFLERQLRIFRSMSGCLFRGSSIKLLVLIYRLFLPQYSDVGDRTVYSRCTVYVLLKDFTQQVAHGLYNDNAPSTITQGMTGKIQGGALQVYMPGCFSGGRSTKLLAEI